MFVQLQFQMQTAEIEAYQRTQAIVLRQDMVERINANRKSAAAYATAAPLGTASTIDCSSPATLAQRDQCEWHAALLGANETRGGAQLGAMNGARGCISNPVATPVRWQLWDGKAWTGRTQSLNKHRIAIALRAEHLPF